MKLKKKFCSYSLLLEALVLILAFGCRKEVNVTAPEISTSPFTNITATSFVSGGNVISDGHSAILARGVCWSRNLDPTITDKITDDGSGAGNFTSTITGLTGGTEYFVRAYATNIAGTSYGNEIHFTTPVIDSDGNIYSTVVIGDQIWIAQNLKTTRLSDGTNIPMVADNVAWYSLTTPGYCWYRNDEGTNKGLYGALYNWYTVNTGKLCPEGWHVPSEEEWATLESFVGGEYTAGGILKERGTEHWGSPNVDASNDYGFTALPGGYRTGLYIGSFRTKRFYGWWWTSTEIDVSGARGRLMTYDDSESVPGTAFKKNGYSVRCIKDNNQKK
jgi:uncharacterized protein (TIGR02145 family)